MYSKKFKFPTIGGYFVFVASLRIKVIKEIT